MSKDILLRLEGQDHASDLRDQFLSSYDNETRESIIIDVEMTTIPVLLGICFLIGQYLICVIFFPIEICVPKSVDCHKVLSAAGQAYFFIDTTLFCGN